MTDNGVVGKYADIETAKRVLGGVSTRNRFVPEVYTGNVLKRDPHTVGGQMQSSGNAAGFNKWWGGWSDINRLMNMAQNYLNSPTGITISTYSHYNHIVFNLTICLWKMINLSVLQEFATALSKYWRFMVIQFGFLISIYFSTSDVNFGVDSSGKFEWITPEGRLNLILNSTDLTNEDKSMLFVNTTLN